MLCHPPLPPSAGGQGPSHIGAGQGVLEGEAGMGVRSSIFSRIFVKHSPFVFLPLFSVTSCDRFDASIGPWRQSQS